MFGLGGKRGSLARSAATDLYIELLKKSVGNTIYDDDLDLMRGTFSRDAATGRIVSKEAAPMDGQMKYLGQVWPSRAHTMIGVPRLDNLRSCIERVLDDGVEGDFIETGVWRGGACIFMRGILKAYGVTDRTVWVADSFAGLPPGDLVKYPKESPVDFSQHGELAISLDQVQRNFSRYDLLDGQVKFLKGWFRDTLPGAPIRKLSILRLDGDLYESTMDALTLYAKLSPGGFVIVDDYNFLEACNAAIDDFRKQHGIAAAITKIEGGGAFWRKA
ncbi:MAG TPA: TylF/MycF/NovP-related O-methyltransferase [Burkholderiales bacterium]|nr:TylF/MycF/NovP-related O-methyltransferase [Burkholderiales bacterium]